MRGRRLPPPALRRDRRRAPHGRDAGVALVEFALVLPVLVLLLFGLLDFGRAVSYWLDQKHLAHETARFAAVNRNPGTGVTLQQYTHNQAETPEMRNGGTSSVPAPGLEVCISFPNGTSAVGDPVRATTRLTFRWLQVLGLSATQTTLVGSSTQRIESEPTNYAAGSGGTGTCP
jgi:hypothetical protein